MKNDTLKPSVALVLSSGSSRGMAHVGAIRALLDSGYTISSVAGTSMGAIAGGMYAAGQLDAFQQWLHGMDKRRMFSLLDVSPRRNSFVKGDKIMDSLGALIPDVCIEELPIPVTIVATDILTGKDVLFEKGKLIDAIRASMSQPAVFRPVRHGKQLLVDGGLSNPLPLNRIRRTEGDILVSVNVSAPDAKIAQRKPKEDTEKENILERFLERERADNNNYNVLGMLTRSIDILIQQNTHLATEVHQPDINVDIPMNFRKRFDFDHSEELVDYGYKLMQQAVRDYQKRTKEA